VIARGVVRAADPTGPASARAEVGCGLGVGGPLELEMHAQSGGVVLQLDVGAVQLDDGLDQAQAQAAAGGGAAVVGAVEAAEDLGWSGVSARDRAEATEKNRCAKQDPASSDEAVAMV
jgi:hypothetical protein